MPDRLIEIVYDFNSSYSRAQNKVIVYQLYLGLVTVVKKSIVTYMGYVTNNCGDRIR
jgi:hypothetical protein